MVPRPDGPDQRARRRDRRRPRAVGGAAPPGQAARLLRCPARSAADDAGGRRPGRAARAGRATGLQDGRHLRRGVRRPHPVPLQHLRRGERGRAAGDPGRHHPRLRPEPDRSGRRVRLLVRARELRPARGRLRHGHGQLQPGDGLDRLRHEQPALLRAADARGRPRGRPRRDPGRAGRGGRRPARRADAARARAGAQGCGCPRRGHLAGGDRPRRGPWPLRSGPGRGGSQRAQARHGLQRRRGDRDRP